MPNRHLRIAVVGGGGHVGLPLSLLLASRGFRVTIIDEDRPKLQALRRGKFPFLEAGGPKLLRAVLAYAPARRPVFSHEHRLVADCDVVILTVGTPVDGHLNPDPQSLYNAIHQIQPFLRAGQMLVLRSTVFPGTSDKIHAKLRAAGLKVSVSFCPERIAQGKALKELQEFPQIISGSDEAALEVARTIFSSFASEVIELGMTEAELAKLFTNAWRYITFAVANQFYMLATEKGLDFYRIRDGIVKHYPRASDLPTAGFAAGPCLFKDTMQLAAYHRQGFTIGHAAMLLNETLPDFLIEQVKRERSLVGARVGILGMAFKADNDDSRDSLAYKLHKLLTYENAIVLCTDPYIKDPSFASVETVLASCEVLFIGCPRTAYRYLSFDGKRVVDCWGFLRSQPKGYSTCPPRKTRRAATAAMRA